MCCLRYEVEAYQDFSARAPKKGAKIETPQGEGEVVELDVLREMVKLRFKSEEDAKPELLSVPLSAMSCKLGKKCAGHGAEGSCCDSTKGGEVNPRPCAITKEAFAEIVQTEAEDDLFAPLPITFKESGKSGEKKSQEAQAPSRKERKRGGRRRRSRQDKGTSSQNQNQNQTQRTDKKRGEQTKQQKPQDRKRKPRKDRGGDSRRGATAAKGSGGTETNVKEAKRVPRRRAR